MSEGIKGTIPCELFGGPLDGAKYGDLPDIDGPYTGVTLTLPLGQPADANPNAIYTCHGTTPVDRLWQFFYERTDYPLLMNAANLAIPETPNGTGLRQAQFDAAAQVSLARGIALMAHRGQQDRDGAEFIAHVARVAACFDPRTQTVAHCAAWLHDLGAHTAVTLADLEAAGIHRSILEVLFLLTRPRGMDDTHHYDRILSDATARAVKLADLADRSAERRMLALDPATRARLTRRYDRARRALALTAEGAH